MSFETKLYIPGASANAEAPFFDSEIEAPAPTDDFTGLPLLILPVEDYAGSFEDQHHAFFSPSRSGFASESGRVLRHSRLQYGSRRLHSRYHGFYDGVIVPTDEHQRFGMAILACAGFIPDTAVDVRRGKPVEVRLTDDEKQSLQEDEIIYTEKRVSALTGRDMNNLKRGIYFMKYALAQDLGHLKPVMLDEFVNTADRKRRLELGMFIVNKAFLRAVEPVEDLYRAAHKSGNIHPAQRQHPVSYLSQVVDGYQPDYFDELAKRISA